MSASWMPHAWRYLGVSEIPGPGDNVDIEDMHRSVDNDVTDDEVAWCSSFINKVMQLAMKPRTKSRAARSWLAWGCPIEDPIYGCVVVLWRESVDSWKGHVGFYIDETDDKIVMLGGNQGNAVSVRRYPKARVLGYRWI